MKRLLDRLPLVLAALFGAGALFHLACLVAPSIGNAASPARHAVFVLVNGLFATAFFARFRWTLVPVLALAAQQAYGHGTDLLRAHAEGRIDVQSLVVLLFLPVVVASAARLAARAPAAPG
ncbi:MAG: hypothetical protein ABJE95_25950 [Byssovorax sp.]